MSPSRRLPLALALLLPAASALSQAPNPRTSGSTSAQSPAAAGSQRFDHEIRLLFRVAACAGSEPVPAPIEAIVAAHCAEFRPTIEKYRKEYLAQAQPFLVSLQPKNLSGTVVYPFGGGDLLSALTTYPTLVEVTTMSLEHAGDPRGIDTITPKELEASLEKIRKRVSGLLIWTESTSENMIQLQRGGLPGQLVFFLVGLAVHGQEPVALRYFTLAADGQVEGFSAHAIESRKGEGATKLNPVWKAPDFSDAFSNSEITFRNAGDLHAPLRVHRHIAADLSNDGLEKRPSLVKYLESKGRVTAMTKAASYLLWSQPFSAIRAYLLDHADFMLSDSTGIPPTLAKSAGFEVFAYGKYEGPFLSAPADAARDMRSLFTSQPERPLKFRYGYPDNAHHDHLVMIRRPETPRAAR